MGQTILCKAGRTKDCLHNISVYISIAKTAIGLGLVTSHPEFELAAKSCMSMFVGTLPEVHRHIEAVDKGFGTSKGEYSIVGEMGSGTEQLHLIIIFYPVASPLVGAASNITNSFAYQVVIHHCRYFMPQRYDNYSKVDAV